MLEEAPIEGPHHPSEDPPDAVPHRWHATNRFCRSGWRQILGEPGGEGQRYPGFDYMLLHNLYYIVSPFAWQRPEPPVVIKPPRGDP